MESVQQPVEIPNAIPYLSFSRMMAYHGCGEKYRLAYVERAEKTPQGPYLAGIAVHDTIEEAEKYEWWNDKDPWQQLGPGAQFFNMRFGELIEQFAGGDVSKIRWAGRKTKQFPKGEDDKWWYANGPMMLRRYADTRRSDHEKGYVMKQEDVEMQLLVELPSGTQLTMRLDAFLMVSDDGEMVIRDYKTGKSGDGLDYALQLATYGWGIEQRIGTKVLTGEICYLRQADRNKRVPQVDLRPWLPLVEPMYAQLEDGIRKEIFFYRPSNFCKSCNVKDHCAVGRLY